MLKVGIVGMGGMGWFHATRYLQLPNVQIAAIADRIPERLQASEAVQINIANQATAFDFTQVARYKEAADLIADAEVDVVDICLPTDLHAPHAVSALEQGRHVLCEKPMALTVEDADRMIVASERSGRLLMIAQCIRFWPEYLFLRDLIQRQPYGKLLSLNMVRVGGRPAWSPDNWFLDPARSGGVPLDLHIHDVDYVNAVLGMPDHITASIRCSEGSQAADIIHATFDYAGGPQVHMHAGWSTAQIPFTAGFEAWFDRAFLRYQEGALSLYTDLDRVTRTAPEIPQGDAYLNEIAYFLRCVEAGEQPALCHPLSTRDSLALVLQEASVTRV